MNSEKPKNAHVQEILKCGRDPIYFIETYVKIQHPVRGLIPFKVYPFQKECVEAFQEHRKNIVLKSRQLGLSTITSAYAVWLALFHREKNILVIATKKDTAQLVITKVKIAISGLPKWLVMPSTTKDTQTELKFSNGSTIKAVSRSDDAGRGEAVSLLIVDEAAFIQGFENIWIGLQPVLNAGGSVILLSTPSGVGNTYHKIWVDAVSKENGFNPIKLMWDAHPERDQAWFDTETKGQSKKYIEQEFLCSFFGSGDTFLQTGELEWLRNNIKPPRYHAGDDRNVWVWENPKPGHSYVMSADTARGDSKDYSTFHIIDSENCEVVAEYKGKLPPDKLAILCNEWGRNYNEALLCPENNSYGFTTCDKLKTLAYPKLYYSNNGSSYVYEYVPQDGVPGFSTQSKSRTLILAKFEELIRNKILHSYSERLADEVQTFTYVNGSPRALKNYNDDLVMSLAIGAWVMDTVIGYKRESHEVQAALVKNMKMDSRDTTILPIFVGNNNKNQQGSIYQYGKVYSSDVISNKSAEINDYSWLLK